MECGPTGLGRDRSSRFKQRRWNPQRFILDTSLSLIRRRFFHRYSTKHENTYEWPTAQAMNKNQVSLAFVGYDTAIALVIHQTNAKVYKYRVSSVPLPGPYIPTNNNPPSAVVTDRTCIDGHLQYGNEKRGVWPLLLNTAGYITTNHSYLVFHVLNNNIAMMNILVVIKKLSIQEWKTVQ